MYGKLNLLLFQNHLDDYDNDVINKQQFIDTMESILLEENQDPQITKCVGVWSERDNTFLTQEDISVNMIKEIEFHVKCLRDDIIDCEDFAVAIEQISAHYYAMNFELIKTR